LSEHRVPRTSSARKPVILSAPWFQYWMAHTRIDEVDPVVHLIEDVAVDDWFGHDLPLDS